MLKRRLKIDLSELWQIITFVNSRKDESIKETRRGRNPDHQAMSFTVTGP
jgi:hypothetical protein